jgi:uncharacterized membrane protein YcaP (DUF421 family)
VSVDLHALFVPETPLEMLVRGTAMYWFLFLLFRFVIRRRVGAVGMADILILVIVADAAQNAMAGDYKTVADGMILVATLLGWNVLTDWLTFRFPGPLAWLQPAPLLLMRHGRLIHRNLRSEFITEDELRSKLRENDVADYSEVDRAYMESDGAIAVVKRRGSAPSGRPASGTSSPKSTGESSSTRPMDPSAGA